MASVHAEDNNDTNSTDVKTYTDLSAQINETENGGGLNLADDYKYDNNTDNELVDGVKISKNISIVGKEDYSHIDGSYIARGIYIESYCNVVLENLIFQNGYTNKSGAGIFLKANSNLTLINCIFKDNKVYNSDGGALNAQYGTNIKVHGCVFDNNTSLRESDLEWSKFKAGMGSAIIAHRGSIVDIQRSTFRNNYAYLSTVLVVSYEGSKYKMSSLNVRDCLFEYNTIYNCGIIYLDEMGSGEIQNSTFRYNINTHSGGVLELDACISCTVKDCKFTENYGTSGGAIKIKVFNNKYSSKVDIIGCDFTSNNANNYGGAIYSDHGIVKISKCTFKQNYAGKHGGAIYANVGEVEIENCKFNENYVASNGGAIFSQEGPVKISNCKFTQNSANNGGALYLTSENNVIASSSFVQNDAISKGGAIYSTSESFKISKLTYSKNTADTASKVYGAFNAKVYQYTYTSSSVKIKVQLTSPWSMSVKQKVKIKITGPKSHTSKWVKADANGVVYFIVPFKVNIAKSKITVSVGEGVGIVKSWTKVKDKAKIEYSKNVKKPSKIKLTIKNKATKKLIKKTKFTIKVYTGNKYKVYKIKTNAKGVLKIATSKLTRAKHKIIVVLNNSNYNINNKIYVKVK
jgi:predicted outer membrane repeat protein